MAEQSKFMERVTVLGLVVMVPVLLAVMGIRLGASRIARMVRRQK